MFFFLTAGRKKNRASPFAATHAQSSATAAASVLSIVPSFLMWTHPDSVAVECGESEIKLAALPIDHLTAILTAILTTNFIANLDATLAANLMAHTLHC